MFPSASLLALAGTLLLTIADKVPALDVESSCRAAAKMGDSLSLDATLRQCLADEKSARDELDKQWTQFPVALRQRCVTTTETGGDPSYVEVLVCLQMGRDARWKILWGAVGKTRNDTNQARIRDLIGRPSIRCSYRTRESWNVKNGSSLHDLH